VDLRRNDALRYVAAHGNPAGPGRDGPLALGDRAGAVKRGLEPREVAQPLQLRAQGTEKGLPLGLSESGLCRPDRLQPFQDVVERRPHCLIAPDLLLHPGRNVRLTRPARAILPALDLLGEEVRPDTTSDCEQGHEDRGQLALPRGFDQRPERGCRETGVD
jgi:hypothetical protein